MVFAQLPCGIYSEFIQERIQDASTTLFTAVQSKVGFSFVHSTVQVSLLLVMFKIDFLLLGGVATYDPIIRHVCHTTKSLLPW